jgi:hypothetical protein
VHVALLAIAIAWRLPPSPVERASPDAGAGRTAPFHEVGAVLFVASTWHLLRAFGFRRVRLANGLLNAASILACALLSPATPVPLVATVLFARLTRSIRFSAYITIAFADIPRQRLAAANTLFSIAFRFAMGLGTALDARGLLAGELRIAFLLVAMVGLVALASPLPPGRPGALRIRFCAKCPGQLPHRTVGEEYPDHLPRIAPHSADSVRKAAGRDDLFVVEDAVVFHQAVKILAVEDRAQKGSVR